MTWIVFIIGFVLGIVVDATCLSKSFVEELCEVARLAAQRKDDVHTHGQ